MLLLPLLKGIGVILLLYNDKLADVTFARGVVIENTILNYWIENITSWALL